MMQRVLVVLPNWIGETLFATPFLRALREQRPDAFIATLGWPSCREVLQHNPRINAMLDYRESRAPTELFRVWRVAGGLRGQRFDTAFILRASLTRALLAALAGIPQRVGWARGKSGWLLTHRVHHAATPVHKANTYLPLLDAVGLPAVPGPCEYVVSAPERAAARAWLATLGVAVGDRLAILHLGANWPHKRWVLERFAALGDRLAQRAGMRVLLTGAPEDAPIAAAVARSMRCPAIAAAGQTTLRQLGAAVEQAALVVANDTGILHIAAAVGRPVVGLYGPTSPRLTGPLGDPARTIVLHHPDCCPEVPCYRPDAPPHAGMASIPVDEVEQAALRLLNHVS